MKKLLTAFFLIFSTISFAQKLVEVNLSDIDENLRMDLSGTWATSFDYGAKSVQISNGRIQNNRNTETGQLELRYIILTEPYKANQANQGYMVGSFPFKAISGKTSVAGVSITSSLEELPHDGTYYPLVVLYERRDMVYVPVGSIAPGGEDKPLLVKNKTIEDAAPEPKEEIVEAEPEAEEWVEDIEVESKPGETFQADLYKIKSEKLVMADVGERNYFEFRGDWQTTIDFKNLILELEGTFVKRTTNKNPVMVGVYLVKKSKFDMNESKTGYKVSGQKLTTFPWNFESEGAKEFIDVKIKANLTHTPIPGTYYVLLTASQEDANGNMKLNTYRLFENGFSF